jgi:hypothetical protein
MPFGDNVPLPKDIEQQIWMAATKDGSIAVIY